uniref:Tetratricopeptide repeat protein n=1 Tax=Rhodosorus marinus TaxID=101924 RepID=A0A7S2ZJ89_9RHOD|mmetsp:Transcript_21382/g.87341  ORF Transcript_21382/g.87341 Transcript_21382/m.87341 type:complete len:330 (+) Transcript_21382:40-1029(+)
MEGSSLDQGKRVHNDPVDGFLGRANSREEAAILLSNLNPVTPDVVTIDSIKYLASSLAWGAVLEASGSILHGDVQLDINTKLEVITFRIAAMMQTRQFDRAAEQIAAIREDMRKYFLEASDGLGEKLESTYVPFELKALSVDILARKGSPKALEAFYELKDHIEIQHKACSERSDGAGVAVWRSREQMLLSSLAAYYLRSQKIDAALDTVRELIRRNPDSAVYCFALLRILVLSGNFSAAREVLSRAAEYHNVTATEIHMHRGIILAAEGSFDEALDEFEGAILLDSRNTAAANNAAICLLHLGRIDEAIEKLVSAVCTKMDSTCPGPS